MEREGRTQAEIEICAMLNAHQLAIQWLLSRRIVDGKGNAAKARALGRQMVRSFEDRLPPNIDAIAGPDAAAIMLHTAHYLEQIWNTVEATVLAATGQPEPKP